MGLASRDYYRDVRGGDGGSFMAEAPTCKKLLIATVVVYLAQILLTRPYDRSDFQRRSIPGHDGNVSLVQQWLELDTDRVLHGQIWRLITCAFCHDRFSVWHILFNMLFLYWFGRTLELQYGSREFLIFYLTAAVFASVAYVAIQLWTGGRNPAIGASGAVMAVVCLFTIHYPNHVIYVMYLIPVRMRILLLIYVILDVHPLLMQLAGTPMNTGIAHAAHLGGLVFGYVYWRCGWRLERAWDSIVRLVQQSSRHLGPRRRVRVYRGDESSASDGPREPQFDSRVDAILQKISDRGVDSLTTDEQAVLAEASRKYRDAR